MTKTERLVALAALGWLVFRPKPPASKARTAAPPPPKPRPLARIYQKEGDSYETVRMSVETPNMPAQEMGIFSTRAAAEAVAKEKGWAVAP